MQLGYVVGCRCELARFAPILDRALDRRKYLVGDDITSLNSMIHLDGLKEEVVPFDWSPYPNLDAYFERMRSVPHTGRVPQPSPAAKPTAPN